MTEFPFVTVYSITYNQLQIVRQTILDLFSQDYLKDRYEIVILDDGSIDGTPGILKQIANSSPIPMRVIAVRHEADYLSARRWNQCIVASSPQTEIFIQIDDVQLRSDFIQQHIKWHLKKGDFLVTGAKFEGNTEVWDLNTCRRNMLAGPDGTATKCNYLAAWGASLSFSRRMVEKVWQEPYDRPYDERMVGWGFQETEFAYRAQMAGAQVVYDPAAGVFHKKHSKATETIRGLKREALVHQGKEQNEHYLREKHGLQDLPWW